MSKNLAIFYFLTFSLCAQPLDQKTFSNIFKRVNGSVVTIRVSTTAIVDGQPKAIEGRGSGVIISDDGLIVTNKHVIADKTRSFKIVLANGQEMNATFVGMSPDIDLSLIKLNSILPSGIVSIPLGDSDQLEEGDWVLAIGSPFGLGGTLTSGIVSTKARSVPLPDENGGQTQLPQILIQTDAAINPGNSGGALINLKGELIGVPTMILSSSGSNAGIGFAIPSNIVKKVTADIIGKRTVIGWFGISVQALKELSSGIKKQLGLEPEQEGILVTALEPRGQAEKAGLKPNDIILKIGNEKISGVDDFRWRERNFDQGERIVLQIKRYATKKTDEIEFIVGKPKQ